MTVLADRLRDGLEVGPVVARGEVPAMRVGQRAPPAGVLAGEPGEVAADPGVVGAAGIAVQRGTLQRRGVALVHRGELVRHLLASPCQ